MRENVPTELRAPPLLSDRRIFDFNSDKRERTADTSLDIFGGVKSLPPSPIPIPIPSCGPLLVSPGRGDRGVSFFCPPTGMLSKSLLHSGNGLGLVRRGGACDVRALGGAASLSAGRCRWGIRRAPPVPAFGASNAPDVVMSSFHPGPAARRDGPPCPSDRKLLIKMSSASFAGL